MTIWKFPLTITDLQQVSMPDDATLLSVGNQDGILCLWAMVDPSRYRVLRHIEIIGTGNPMSEDVGKRKFIGTVLMQPFVWHVFERTGER